MPGRPRATSPGRDLRSARSTDLGSCDVFGAGAMPRDRSWGRGPAIDRRPPSARLAGPIGTNRANGRGSRGDSLQLPGRASVAPRERRDGRACLAVRRLRDTGKELPVAAGSCRPARPLDPRKYEQNSIFIDKRGSGCDHGSGDSMRSRVDRGDVPGPAWPGGGRPAMGDRLETSRAGAAGEGRNPSASGRR